MWLVPETSRPFSERCGVRAKTAAVPRILCRDNESAPPWWGVENRWATIGLSDVHTRIECLPRRRCRRARRRRRARQRGRGGAAQPGQALSWISRPRRQVVPRGRRPRAAAGRPRRGLARPEGEPRAEAPARRAHALACLPPLPARERRSRREREGGARLGARCARPRPDGAGSPRRAPPDALRERLPRLAVRGGGGAVGGRVRRLRLDDARARARQPDRRPRPRALPALARHLLHRRHAMARVPELRRRGQGDGAGAVWRAGLRRRDAAAPAPERSAVRARSGLLRPPCGGGRHDLGSGDPDDWPSLLAPTRAATRAPARTGR